MAEVAVAETNGKEQVSDQHLDSSQSSQDKSSKSVSPTAAMKSRPPPPAPKPRKLNTSADSASTSTAKGTTSTTTASKSPNNSPARFAQSAPNRGSAVRQYLKRLQDASEDEVKENKDTAATAVNENVVTSTDSKPASSDSTYKRQLSVREKAAAFFENTTKDSVC